MIPKVRTLSSGILYYRGLNQQPLYFKPRCLTTSLLSPFKCWFFPKSLPSQPIYSENTTVSAMSITGEWATRVSITLLSRRAFIRMRVHLLPGPAEQIETLNKGFLLFPQVRNNQPLILSASSTLRGSKRSLERWITYGEKKKKNTGERMCFFFLRKHFSQMRSGHILTALKSAILVSQDTVTMSTAWVLWPCTAVYRHQLKVDTTTETYGGLDRLLSQHNKSSRIKN